VAASQLIRRSGNSPNGILGGKMLHSNNGEKSMNWFSLPENCEVLILVFIIDGKRYGILENRNNNLRIMQLIDD
jgi:hypothetical protein